MGYYSKWQLLVTGNCEQLSEFQSFIESQIGPECAHRNALENRFQYLADAWDSKPISLGKAQVGMRYVAEYDKCYSPNWEEFLSVLFTHFKATGLEYSLIRTGETPGDVEEVYSDGAGHHGSLTTAIDNPFDALPQACSDDLPWAMVERKIYTLLSR